MQCEVCGHDNRPGSKFCAQCGNELGIVCGVCAATAPAGSRFCDNCGNSLVGREKSPRLGEDVTRYVPPEMLTKIQAAQASNTMRGERRTVTMLFADIKGSTAGAEQVDPEDWTDIINGAFEHLIEPVYRYEGTLARLLGDAVLAFFGAPIAHEDDPVRAVRAGLEIVEAMEPYKAEIQRRWGIPIDVRVGINTGLVVVGAVGSDLRVEYTALGDAVNVAARMEQTAEPGTVRVTGDTWALVSEHFEAEEIGPVEVKGKSEPVTAFRVVARRGAPAGPKTVRPLIGRSAQLEKLMRLLDRLEQGSGWVASIIGEAGVGKTRLLAEFRHQAAPASTETDAVAWMGASVQSFDASLPFSLIRDLLTRWWALGEAEDPYLAVSETAARTVPDLADGPAYLAYVAGVPLPEAAAGFVEKLEPPVLQNRARGAVLTYLEAEAREQPVVVALEDLHWADPVSLSLVEDLMHVAERAPLGLLFTMRPYRDEPTWHVHEVAQRDHPHRYHPVEMTSLEADDTETLLDILLEGLDVPSDLRARIAERSDGNPLFMEQMAQAIRNGEASLEEASVPVGLTSLLTARLDRLDEESRVVAQVASVVGFEFHRRTLASLVGDEVDLDRHLIELLRREIFVERGEGAGSLGFHHSLMHDAAYSTMLLRTRRDLHRRLAEHMEAAGGAPQEIARHFVEAGDMERAFPHLVEAGERSWRSMALSDAIRFFTTALDNSPATADPELVIRAHDGLGTAYSLVPDLTQSEATYQRLADFAENSGHPSGKVTALNRLAYTSATLGGDLEGAHRYLGEARALAETVGDEYGLAEYHMNACLIAGLSGDVAAAAQHDEETIRWGSELGVAAIRIEGLVRLAINAAALMDFERAESAICDALEAATQAGDERALGTLKAMALSRLHLRDGDVDGARRLLEEGVEVLDRYQSFYAPIASMFLASLMCDTGEIEGAIGRLVAVRQAVAEANISFFVAATSAMLDRIYSVAGLEAAQPEMREAALDAVAAPLGDYLASTVWAELGFGCLARRQWRLAGEDFDRGIASSSASKYWEKPRLLIGRALAHAAQGEVDDARRNLDEAETFVMDKGLRGFEPHLIYARGELLLAEGRPDEAVARLREGLDAAAAAGLKVLGLNLAMAAARGAGRAGDDQAARRHVDWARSEVERIARSVADPELRGAIEAAWLTPIESHLAG